MSTNTVENKGVFGQVGRNGECLVAREELG